MSLRSYPKVFNLGHRAVVDLLNGPVVVQEKVDGSQFSFGVVPDKRMEGATDRLAIRSRGADIDPDGPPKMFAAGVETVKALFEAGKLVPGMIYRGEYLEKPKHNVLAYDRVPKGHVILFDIEGPRDQEFATTRLLHEAADYLGLERVPTIFEGAGTDLTLEIFKQEMESLSILGGQKVEGVVIKAYGRYGIDGKTIMGKHVSEAYKEVHAGEWKAANPGGRDVIALLIAELRTPARWEKAIQHLREANALQDAPQDIGPLLKEINSDVIAECEALIKDRLFKWAWKDVARGIITGFPQFYKEKLAALQFERPVSPDGESVAGSESAQNP